MKPGDLVGVNKDTFLILDTLPLEFDSTVKAMKVDEKPTEDYWDIGGLEKQASLFSSSSIWVLYTSFLKYFCCWLQIEELVEAIVLPMTHNELFQKLGVRTPKGVLLYGPPGTGKTLFARVCADQTNATFLRLAGTQFVQVIHFSVSSLIVYGIFVFLESVCCLCFFLFTLICAFE